MTAIKPKDIRPDSIEKVVCDAMSKLTTVPMNDDTTRVMIMFMLDEESKEKAAETIESIWQANAIATRMEAQFNRKMDPRAAILIALWAKSVGSCVLYMYYCQYMCNKRMIEGEFTMDHLVDFFPMGFFQDADIHAVWDAQKVFNRREEFEGLEFTSGSDNLVDYGYAAQSLGFIYKEEAEKTEV